ncbi:MAG: homocysteine S-methyltransferase family protein, partial [Acutalibacteraceae bacterium]|nr:homocysteine S-methyltransferase family protein [Acutalibacteraceae bacterium]
MFNKLLKENKFIILDGAMGTQLQAKGLKTGECPEALSITNPEVVEEIHRSYITSGSMIVYANTFGANSYKLADSGYSVAEVVKASISVAKKATADTDSLVALDIGPIGKLMEPTGSMSFDEAYNIYKEIIEAGELADLIVFETMTDLAELKAGVLAAKENSNKPVMCTMTFEENMRTFTGCSISAMAITLEGLGVDAVGVNCSLGPVQLQGVVAELAKWRNLPIIVKPNAGLPDPATGGYNLTPADFAKSMVKSIVPTGALILGGCCGTTPEYIKALTSELSKASPVKRNN